MSLKRILVAAGLIFLAQAPAVHAAEINLYTTREPGLMQPLIEAFTKSTGTKINTIFLKDGLAERVSSEGDKSPADILMTVDAGRLVDLADKGLTQSVQSEVLTRAIPEALRDANGNWFALSLRARAIFAAKDLDIKSLTYEQLADPSWKGKICTRSAQHPYNISLISAYIAHHGEAAGETWLSNLKSNLAGKPAGGDRDVARDIKAGLCEIGIANSYYLGVMRSGKGGAEQAGWANAIKMILPTFEGGGTHVNISGAALARHAPHKQDAIAFLEFLASDDAQKIYAEANFEYPVNPKIAVHPFINEFGQLRPDTMDIAKPVRFRKVASELVDKVGFDN